MSTFEETLYAFLLSPAATKDSMLKLADFVSALTNSEEFEFGSDLQERDIRKKLTKAIFRLNVLRYSR